jgi:hypothetical protein
MDSKKPEKQERAEGTTTRTLQGRRRFLQLGAVGAALLAANMLAPDLRAADQPVTRTAAKQGVQKSLHAPPTGRAARKVAAVKTQAELSATPSGTRSTKRQAMSAAPKAMKSAEGDRSAPVRKTAQVATQKAMKVQSQ